MQCMDRHKKVSAGKYGKVQILIDRKQLGYSQFMMTSPQIQRIVSLYVESDEPG